MQASELFNLFNRGKLTGVQVGVMLTCWLINMLDGFDVLAIAFTAPTISAEWTLKPGTLGVVLSAGLVGMALGALFIAPLADRFGRRTVTLWCLAAIGSAMLATSQVTNVNMLLFTRLVTGLGVGGVLASLNTMVAEYAPGRGRNFAISFLQSGYAIGGVAGGLVAAALIPAFGWQSVFIAGGVATLLMVVFVLVLMPESLHYLVERRPPNALSEINRVLARLREKPITELPIVEQKGPPPGIARIFEPEFKSRTLLLWLSFFMSMLTLYFLLLWTPQIVVNAGLPTGQSIIVGTVLNVGGLVGMLVLGWLSERLGLYRLIMVFFLLAALSMVAFAIIEASPSVLLVLAFILGFFTVGGMIGLYSASAGIYPTSVRSTGLGWGIGIGRIGAILGPNIAGMLMGIGWEQSDYFLLLAVPLLVAMVSTFGLRRAVGSE